MRFYDTLNYSEKFTFTFNLLAEFLKYIPKYGIKVKIQNNL